MQVVKEFEKILKEIDAGKYIEKIEFFETEAESYITFIFYGNTKKINITGCSGIEILKNMIGALS